MIKYEFLINDNNKKIKFKINKKIEEFKFNSDSSYLDKILYKTKKQQTFFDGPFSIKMKCYENIKKNIEGKYKTFFDLYGGIGITAKLFELDEKNTYVNDYDVECYNILNNNFLSKNVYNEDAFKMVYENKFDLVLADFNDLTIKRIKGKYKKVLEDIFNNSNKYVILNDCSIYHLKFGIDKYTIYEKMMGIDIEKTRIGFFNSLKKYYKKIFPKWSMVQVEYSNDSSFILFEKTEVYSKLKINKNNKEQLIKSKPVYITYEHKL